MSIVLAPSSLLGFRVVQGCVTLSAPRPRCRYCRRWYWATNDFLGWDFLRPTRSNWDVIIVLVLKIVCLYMNSRLMLSDHESNSLLSISTLILWCIASSEHLLFNIYLMVNFLEALHIADVVDPMIGITLDLSPRALCRDFSLLNILTKCSLVMYLLLNYPLVNILTRLCLSACAYPNI